MLTHSPAQDGTPRAQHQGLSTTESSNRVPSPSCYESSLPQLLSCKHRQPLLLIPNVPTTTNCCKHSAFHQENITDRHVVYPCSAISASLPSHCCRSFPPGPWPPMLCSSLRPSASPGELLPNSLREPHPLKSLLTF